jgi:hypothetical protein
VTQYFRVAVKVSRDRGVLDHPLQCAVAHKADDDGGELLPLPLDNLHQFAADMFVAADHVPGLQRVA